MSDILSTIAARALERVKERKKIKSLGEIIEEAETLYEKECGIGGDAEDSRGRKTEFPFEKALKSEEIAFICEVKKASPSKGILDEVFPYREIAAEYEKAGAAAISVLTEPDWFLGSDAYLKEIREVVTLPILRKDFTVDVYQIYEAKTMGADAILLICALMNIGELKNSLEIAHSIGLSALVEAHTEEEVHMAVEAGARIIGVNNRNLKTFEVDITTSIRLRKLVPENILFISESGIKTSKDIAILKENKIDGVLVGEALMKSRDKKYQLDQLRGAADL